MFRACACLRQARILPGSDPAGWRCAAALGGSRWLGGSRSWSAAGGSVVGGAVVGGSVARGGSLGFLTPAGPLPGCCQRPRW
jgi:hypothetical protein